jgi:uncharacterized protein involved in exopolysaccharide biosynthesis
MNQKSTIQISDVYANLLRFLGYLAQYKKWLLIISIAGIAAGLAYTIYSKKEYSAHVSFMINENDKLPSVGSLSSLANQLGVGGGALNVNDDKIIFLIPSKRILGTALLVNIKNKTLADHFIDELQLKKRWEKDEDLSKFDRFKHQTLETLDTLENYALDNILKQIIKSGKLKFDAAKKKTVVGNTSSGIISIEYSSTSELISKSLIEEVYKTLSDFYINTSIERQLSNYNLLCSRADSIKNILMNTEVKLATLKDEGMVVRKFIGKVNEGRSHRDVELLNSIYVEILKNREVAKYNLDQQKPVFQLIDFPTIPLDQKVKSKLVYSLLGMIVFDMMLFVFLTFSYVYINVKSTIKSMEN